MRTSICFIRQLLCVREFRVTRKVLLALVVLAAATAAFTAQKAADNSAEVGKVKFLETLWNQAEVDQDTRALGDMVPETFTYVDIDGSLKTKPEFLESIKTSPEKPSEIRNESIVVHVYGDTVVATGVYREKGSSAGKLYSRRGRFTDTWVKANNTWQCVASQLTLIQK
jgi:ketosteroid isomerase-like protein